MKVFNKKFIGIILGLCLTITSAFGANFPQDMQNFLKKSIPDVDIRFDGVIICPDGIVYLPLYPASMKKPDKIEVAQTYPEKASLGSRPDVIILNNDYVLLKVIPAPDGKKTIKRFDKPPIVIKTGILPQDMLVPKGLIIPENMKGIVGNLKIELEQDPDIKVTPSSLLSARFDSNNKNFKKLANTSTIGCLKDKSLYMVSAYSKNISVVQGEQLKASYALAQNSTPIDCKITKDNKFLFVTTYDSTLVNVISIADDRIIKQFDLTAHAGEILIDDETNTAYVMAPSTSTINVIDINKMVLTKRIKVNGRCEKPVLYNNTIVYLDKLSDTVWSVELGGDYTLKNFGQFPNISKVLYQDGLILLSSRTKNRVAVINYNSKKLISEFEVVEKPIDMIVCNHLLYVLGAAKNEVQIFSMNNLEPITTIKVSNEGFATKFCPIKGTNLLIITDTKLSHYTIFDTDKNTVVKINSTEIPVNNILVGKRVTKIK